MPVLCGQSKILYARMPSRYSDYLIEVKTHKRVNNIQQTPLDLFPMQGRNPQSAVQTR